MADLIDRQAVVNAICEMHVGGQDAVKNALPNTYGADLREIIEEINALPSAQPEPSEVARDIATIIENEIDMRVIAQSERKKGRWIDTESSYADGVRQECRCSVCSRLSSRPLGDFCKWCGADMRGEEDG